MFIGLKFDVFARCTICGARRLPQPPPSRSVVQLAISATDYGVTGECCHFFAVALAVVGERETSVRAIAQKEAHGARFDGIAGGVNTVRIVSESFHDLSIL